MDTTVLGNIFTGLRIRGMVRTQAKAMGKKWLNRLSGTLGVTRKQEKRENQLALDRLKNVPLMEGIAGW